MDLTPPAVLLIFLGRQQQQGGESYFQMSPKRKLDDNSGQNDHKYQYLAWPILPLITFILDHFDCLSRMNCWHHNPRPVFCGAQPKGGGKSI